MDIIKYIYSNTDIISDDLTDENIGCLKETLLLSITNNCTRIQELRGVIVKWKNAVEILFKKLMAIGKREVWRAPLAGGKQKFIVQTELFTAFISWNDRLAYTVACINGAGGDYVMDSGNGPNLNDQSNYLYINYHQLPR